MKILAAIPLQYWDGGGFWDRDLGLVVLALRSAGHDAFFVALGDQQDPGDRPLKVVSRKVMADPGWWKAQQADAIILNTWSATRFHDIRSAALSTGCPVIEKMDTDGVRSPRVWFWQYVVENWSANRDHSSLLRRSFAAPLAIFRACVLWSFPRLLDARLAAVMAGTPILAVESPIAVERIKRFIRDRGEPVPRLVCIPHAVNEQFRHSTESIRTNKLIAVGRWAAHQKNFPLLLKVLDGFLRLHPNWSAEVVGGLPEDAESQIARLSSGSRKRIEFAGRVSHQELAPHYQTARIFVMTSRFESFNIAAAEALCCGCSVVGPAEIPSMPFFARESSGSLASRNSYAHMLDALCAEAEAWRQGHRDPSKISALWQETVGAHAVAARFVRVIESFRAIHANSDPDA